MEHIAQQLTPRNELFTGPMADDDEVPYLLTTYYLLLTTYYKVHSARCDPRDSCVTDRLHVCVCPLPYCRLDTRSGGYTAPWWHPSVASSSA